ncbi:hypothetical protein BHAP_1564 [Bifidobacterium hapali]|uniref:Uncharacterized protein n=1 Tax=Bifidobacterium hapali TaxID=1630172 RepID=A0A261FXZ0_9BIFI|nr:hypothetical protein BHAP_1564 [Bifidobacterium hapali]
MARPCIGLAMVVLNSARQCGHSMSSGVSHPAQPRGMIRSRIVASVVRMLLVIPVMFIA